MGTVAALVQRTSAARRTPDISGAPVSRLWLAQSIAGPLGVTGVAAYLAGAALGGDSNLTLLWLAVPAAFLAVAHRPYRRSAAPLLCAVLIFAAASGLSIVMSGDVGRSVRLSTPILPGLLIFFIISTHFASARQVRALYVALSAVALALSALVLRAAARGDWHTLHDRMFSVGSPLLVEANDVTLVALVVPLSCVLLLDARRLRTVLVPALSILASLSAICVARSRVAFLTVLVAVAVVALSTTRRLCAAIRAVVALTTVAVLVDGAWGFPVIAKFQQLRESRVSLWLAAWLMFLDKPILGHGPHTFVRFYSDYLAALRLPEWLPMESRTSPWPHNLYLELLSEQGIVGFAAFATLLAAALWRVSRHITRDTGERSRSAAGALASLLAFCFAGVFELSLLRAWVVLLLFTLLGVVSRLSIPQERT
jgi:O-antigen ligase